MPFFSPVLRVFTPLYEPPHPNLLWDLPESALANVCLSDHQNNAMFISETSAATKYSVEPDGSSVCLENTFSPNTEIPEDVEIGWRSSLAASADTQMKFRQVDSWLEEQSRNTVAAGPSGGFREERTETIPHHLLVQLGLANNVTIVPESQEISDEPRVLREPDDDVYLGANGIFDAGRYDTSSCLVVQPVGSNEPVGQEESPSSLSQLFHDELNEQDKKEIAQSIETIGQTVGGKGYFLEGTGNYRNDSKLLDIQVQSKGWDSVYPERMPGQVSSHQPSNGCELLPNDRPDCPDGSRQAPRLSKRTGNPEVLETRAVAKSKPTGEIAEKSSRPSPKNVEVPTTPARWEQKLRNNVRTPITPMKRRFEVSAHGELADTSEKPSPEMETGKFAQPRARASPQLSEAIPNTMEAAADAESPKSGPKTLSDFYQAPTAVPMLPLFPPNDEHARRNSAEDPGHSSEVTNAVLNLGEYPNPSGCTADTSPDQIDVTVSERDLPSQSSLSQLFQAQEFTVDHYMEIVRCGSSGKSDRSNVDQVKHMDEEDSPEPNEDIVDSSLEIRRNPMKMNSQPFVIKGHEPKMFDISVKREEDRPWKEHVAEGVLEPSNEVSKRNQKIVEEIPVVVSPYFPNHGNHPVQDDKRTGAEGSAPPFNVSQVLNSQDSQDVLGKILNYERATNDYQICKNFFSQRSPPSTPKSESIPEARKLWTTVDEGTSKTKKSRIPKKDQPGRRKITDYFSVLKNGSKTEPKTKRRQIDAKHSQSVERSSGKFHFEDLPSGNHMVMSNFIVPRSTPFGKSNLEATQKADAALSSSKNVRETAKPETVANSSTSTQLPGCGRSLEVHRQNASEFDWFPRQCRRTDDENLEVIHLKEDQVEEIASAMEKSGDLLEIGFTICYRQKYSRLNMPDDGSVHTPCGIMSRVEFAESKTLVLYQDMDGLVGENGRSFVMCLLESKCRKVCYEAQAFIMFILDVLKEEDLKICYDWHLFDPMIAKWLIDPDHPPKNFSLLLNELRLKAVNNETGDWKLTVSGYLSIQSEAMESLHGKLVELGLWNVFSRMETPITSILAAMELRNIQVDYPRLKETSEVLQISALERDAWKLVGRKFQMSSPLQLRRILYEELKLDEIGGVSVKTTATSKAKSTDEGTLKLLAGLHPLPGLVLEYRHAQKIRSTYIDGLLTHVADKRSVSTTWEQCAAATGRLTSSSPNMQSIPKRDEAMTIAGESFNVRKVFTSRPGCRFVAVDFQQIELRTFAHLSRDERLISVLNQPGDIFVTMTKMRLGTDEFDSAEREKTKTLMYALLYGAGAHKISEVLSVDAETASRICGDFYRLFPGLKNFRSSVLEECRAHKVLHSLSGRRRLFPFVTGSCIKRKRYTERQAVNFIIQGSAADICKAAMIRTESALRESGIDAKLLLQIHDELLWEVPETLESQVTDAIRKSIEETSDYWTEKFNLKVSLPVKITTGSSWGSMK